MDESTSRQVIKLAPMQQLAEALDREDDWTGLTDAAARRKRQNRLNQRAYRRRKALEARPSNQGQQKCYPGCYQWEDAGTETMRLTPKGQYVLNVILSTLSGTNQPSIHAITQGPTTTTTTSSSSSSSFFPLSTDHLIPLIQLNVLRATLTNMSLLSIQHAVPPECGTALLLPLHPTPPHFPAGLAPTPLQEHTPHADWIDLIPSPALRDSCIRWAHTIDEDELFSDLLGGLYEGQPDSDARGWIVWRDPWDVGGWEVTEGFVEKWGRLLRGCHDIIEASNRWRALRGEDALVVEV